MLFSSPLVTLILAAAPAHAVSIETIEIAHEPGGIVALTSGDGVLSTTAEVESDAGKETVTLVESDAWLHGSGEVKALPAIDATGTLTVYDASNNVLATFSGTVGTDGTMSFAADRADADEDAECASKEGCGETSEADKDTVDIEVLAATAFVASGGYDLAFDLNGADTHAIAYADLTLTEGDVVTTCDKQTGECTTTGTSTITKVEVGWDAVGAVWEGTPTLSHEGLVQVKAKAYDADGKKLLSASSKLGMPWDDGGYGVNALATDEDPFTTVGLLTDEVNANGTEDDMNKEIFGLTVVSQGWSGSSTLPASAQVEVTGGKTITIPANSYQVSAEPEVFTPGWGDVTGFEASVDGTTASFAHIGPGRHTCRCNGSLLQLTDNEDGTWTLAISAYALDAGKLPDTASVKITPLYEKGSASDETEGFDFTFEDEVAVVFANEVTLSQDPLGLDVSGKVSLLGAADKQGKTKTLAKGTFYGTFSRDLDGDLALGGADKDLISAKGDILIGGEPIDFELTDTNKDGVVEAPPAVVLKVYSDGKGTRAVCTSGTGNPGLL